MKTGFRRLINSFIEKDDREKILLGKILLNSNNEKRTIGSLEEVEFKVFSQCGDDGIIQYLINKIKMPQNFVEFGVENYKEANTRFLLVNNNWTGLVIDGSNENIQSIYKQDIYYKYDLTAVAAFITVENINHLISSNGFSGEIGILSVDIDGNDFWVLKAIQVVNPVVIIVEYNSVFGDDRYISIPYTASFNRTAAHFSNLYWGASIAAFCHLCEGKGYTLIGCTSSGNNAYFVRNDKLTGLPTPGMKEGYVTSKQRESRNKRGQLTFLSGSYRLEAIKGLKVIEVRTNASEYL